jgi:hypothetical protein
MFAAPPIARLPAVVNRHPRLHLDPQNRRLPRWNDQLVIVHGPPRNQLGRRHA